MVWYVTEHAFDDKTNKLEERVVCIIAASDISEARRRVAKIWPDSSFRVSDKPPVPDRAKSSVKLKASPPQSGEYTSS
jgi:hypothetical protein